MAKAEVFKIQRPLDTNDPSEPMALVYNQFRTIQFLMPMDSLGDLFKDGEEKVYWLAKSRKKELELIKREKDQGW